MSEDCTAKLSGTRVQKTTLCNKYSKGAVHYIVCHFDSVLYSITQLTEWELRKVRHCPVRLPPRLATISIYRQKMDCRSKCLGSCNSMFLSRTPNWEICAISLLSTIVRRFTYRVLFCPFPKLAKLFVSQSPPWLPTKHAISSPLLTMEAKYEKGMGNKKQQWAFRLQQ